MTVTGYNDPDAALDAAVREVPARKETGDLDVQLDKLTALVAQLEDRLDWVRFRRPHPELAHDPAATDSDDRPKASTLVTDLRHHTDVAKRLQERLVVLLNELEV